MVLASDQTNERLVGGDLAARRRSFENDNFVDVGDSISVQRNEKVEIDVLGLGNGYCTRTLRHLNHVLIALTSIVTIISRAVDDKLLLRALGS